MGLCLELLLGGLLLCFVYGFILLEVCYFFCFIYVVFYGGRGVVSFCLL